MFARTHRFSSLLFLALVLSWMGGLSAHDAHEHAGEWEHGDECGLYHHIATQEAPRAELPAPVLLESEDLATPTPRAPRNRQAFRGCDRGPPPSV